MKLPEHGEIPLVAVGDSAFPAHTWLMKAFPDTITNVEEEYNHCQGAGFDIEPVAFLYWAGKKDGHYNNSREVT